MVKTLKSIKVLSSSTGSRTSVKMQELLRFRRCHWSRQECRMEIQVSNEHCVGDFAMYVKFILLSSYWGCILRWNCLSATKRESVWLWRYPLTVRIYWTACHDGFPAWVRPIGKIPEKLLSRSHAVLLLILIIYTAFLDAFCTQHCIPSFLQVR